MNTKTLKTINFEDLKGDSHLIEYVDNNIILLDSVDYLASKAQTPCRINCFMMAFCIDGEAPIVVNNKSHLLSKENCVILFPNTIIQPTITHGSCNVRIVAFSPQFTKGIVSLKEETWDLGVYLYHNPILPIRKEKTYKLYLYKELALTSINDKEHPFSNEARKHLFSAIFCELLAVLYQHIPEQEDIPNFRNDRSTYIFRKFVEKVAADDGSHRSVSYYADMLCYSPKHLSTVVKKVSGKAPLTIINEHAIERIKYQLKHSDLSMKEIADLFNFANPSFFGKFVKQHLGMSPQQYRNSMEK